MTSREDVYRLRALYCCRGRGTAEKWNAAVLGEDLATREPDLPQEVVQRLHALTALFSNNRR